MAYKEANQKDWTNHARYQEEVYAGIKPYDNDYGLYSSHFGAQALFFGVLDKISGNKLGIDDLRLINSFLSALVFSFFLYLVYREFGFLATFFCFLGVFFGRWTIGLGKNLYWIMWSMFLPMVINFYYLYRRYTVGVKINVFLWMSLLFMSLVFRFLAGFEYVSTILIAMTVPLFYYGIKYSFTKKEFVKLFMILSLVGIFAFFTSFFVWSIQMYVSSEYDFTKAVAIIKLSILKSTYNIGDIALSKPYQESTSSSVYEVLGAYLDKGFMIPVLLFVAGSILVLYKKIESLYGILFTGVVSLFASVSWFVLAKGHSYMHMHMNFILWYVPFIFFFLIFCAKLLETFAANKNLNVLDYMYLKFFSAKKVCLGFLLLVIIIFSMVTLRKEMRIILRSEVLASYDKYKLQRKRDKLYYVIRSCNLGKDGDGQFFVEVIDKDGLKSERKFSLGDVKRIKSYYPFHMGICVFDLGEFYDDLSKIQRFGIGKLSDDNKTNLWYIDANFN